MRVKDVVFTKGLTGFYFDDQLAIKQGATQNGLVYEGDPVIAGFTKVRQPGESISILIILEDGQVAVGDCAAVQYSGAGGRDPLFLADDYLEFLEEKIKPLLVGRDLSVFKENAEYFDKLVIEGKKLHTAIRYGVTQAVLHAASLINKVTMAELIRKEYNIDYKEYKRVPIFSQSGDNRYENADKMIVKSVDLLSHALYNSTAKLGLNGENIKEYVSWLRNRIIELGDENYHPAIHLDVYGTMGMIYNLDVEKITNLIIDLEKRAHPYNLQIEGPIDAGNKEDTMILLRDIRVSLEEKGSNAKIVADEWCNTLEDIKYFADNKAGHILQIKTPDLGGVNNSIEAALYCNEKGLGSYIGGTCNETNLSAERTVHLAVATNATQILAKPGMGADEAIMIINNEMNRILGLVKRGK